IENRFVSCVYFFFQAEDGIRDRNVTGVQTCALPILVEEAERAARIHQRMFADEILDLGLRLRIERVIGGAHVGKFGVAALRVHRSEERRVGKECRAWWCWAERTEEEDRVE